MVRFLPLSICSNQIQIGFITLQQKKLGSPHTNSNEQNYLLFKLYFHQDNTFIVISRQFCAFFH